MYKIVPTPGARQSGMKVFTDNERGPVNESYVARVINLEHISAQEAVTVPPAAWYPRMASSPPSGRPTWCCVVDSSLNIQKILGILQLIDTDQRREKAEIVFLKNAGAESVAKLISEWLRKARTEARNRPAGRTAASGAGMVLPDTRLNALMVFGSDKDKEDVKKPGRHDRRGPADHEQQGQRLLPGKRRRDRGGQGAGRDGQRAQAPAAPAAAGAAGRRHPQQSLFEGGKISITPDKATNSLVIMASPTDYQNLLQVIQKLDKRAPPGLRPGDDRRGLPRQAEGPRRAVGLTGGGVRRQYRRGVAQLRPVQCHRLSGPRRHH